MSSSQIKLITMKSITSLIAMAAIMTSCNQIPKEEQHAGDSSTPIEQRSAHEKIKDKAVFNIEEITYSEHDLGDFPFFTLPNGLKERSKPLINRFDVCFFPIDSVMTPFEGRLYKADIISERGEEFSQHYFEKSLENYLNSIGGVKIYDGEISREEYNRYSKKWLNRGNQGDIGYFNELIKFYVIRSKTKGNIYVQFSASNSSGKLNILQEETFQQTITKITADDILKDLTQKGKAILYLNFDLDKSDISTEGKDIVNQIAEALRKDNTLKIAIEGHTDNTGDAAYNKKLSNNRAHAVMIDLINQKIDKSRLSAAGFGAERPLLANDSEANKAKNRRVELLKIN